METLLQAYCFETAVTCRDAEAQGPFVKRMAMHLGQFMATYLAETVTALFQRVLSHPAKGLVNETNAALLTQKFWAQAIYTELLRACSRFRAVREKEQQRPPNGLVKVVCFPYDGAAEQRHGRKKDTDASFESMVGLSSWVNSLFIWFPAAWMPLVVDAIRDKTLAHFGGTSQRGAVASTDLHQPEIPRTREFSFKIKRWQVDKSGSCPILQSRVNDPQILTPLFSPLYDGILHDIFIQKASMAWHNAPHSRIMVSLLLPGTMEADEWLYLARGNRHMWPLQMASHSAAAQISTEQFMRRERRRLQARHIWMEVKPKWSKIKERIYTKHATGLPWMTLSRRLFLNEFTEESRWLEDPYKGPNEDGITQQWAYNQTWFTEQATACSPLRWVSTPYVHQLDHLDALAWQWIDYHKRIAAQVWHTKQGVFRRKPLPDVRDDPMRGQQ